MPAYDERNFAPPAPAATIKLRHPDHGEPIEEIPMLIDSGADATLLPRSAVASLGIPGTGELFQSVAFDGTTSESEAVRADLSFADRRFRGRFLMIDAEVGVLGRDVLNHVRLLLDGPALEWQVGPPTEGVS